MSLPTPSGGRIAIGIVLSIVVAIVGSVVWGFTQQIARARQMRTEEIRLEQTVTAEQAHHDDLVAQLDYVRSDEYVEKWAREDMRMAKSGEVVVIIADDAGAEPPANPHPHPTPEPEPKHFWEDLWDLFTPADE
jgi:cell division protein FtsB